MAADNSLCCAMLPVVVRTTRGVEQRSRACRASFPIVRTTDFVERCGRRFSAGGTINQAGSPPALAQPGNARAKTVPSWIVGRLVANKRDRCRIIARSWLHSWQAAIITTIERGPVSPVQLRERMYNRRSAKLMRLSSCCRWVYVRDWSGEKSPLASLQDYRK